MTKAKPKKKRAKPIKKVTDRRLRAALVKSDGLLSQAAKAVGLSRQGLHQRVNGDEELSALVQELRTGHIDLAEGALAYRMRKYHDREAAKFILQYRAKHLGYGQQPEIPPPPPDNSRRAIIVQNLILMLDQKAADIHREPIDVTPKPADPAYPKAFGGALNGNGAARTNGQDPVAQLIAAKKITNKV